MVAAIEEERARADNEIWLAKSVGSTESVQYMLRK